MLAFASLLLIGQVSAGVLNALHMIGRSEEVEAGMRRYVKDIIEPIERRQSVMSGINITEWNAQTEAACTASLEALNGVASNPSGMAVCYNLPVYENTTGVFEADLRLFMISPPSGTFANISSANVQVALSYNGATVSAVNASSLKRRDDGATSLISWPRAVDVSKRAMVPTLIQSYAFVGQINKELLSTNMETNLTAVQKVLVPTVTLSGVDSKGATVSTDLSSNEATFVNGIFAAQASVTKAEVAAPIQTLVVASESPFVVPGLNILIFPIGLIISTIWTVLFVGTIAYGTVGRMQFRDQYRRRTAQAQKGNLARI